MYGEDLSQHGLINQQELAYLLQAVQQAQCTSIVDIGCGNGKITEWISQETNIPCLGIDISSEGIATAQERTKSNPLLQFQVGNLNNIQLENKYDAVLFLDTLYYSSNVKNTIAQAHNVCTNNGAIYAYFSQWIMDDQHKEFLLPDRTVIARVAQELNLQFTYVDLSQSGINHWRKKYEVLNQLRDEFIKEGNEALWQYRHSEAARYASWGESKYARYFYTLRAK